MKTLKLFLCLFIFLQTGRETKALSNNPEEKNAQEVLVVAVDVFGREVYSMLTSLPGTRLVYTDKQNNLLPGVYVVTSSSDETIVKNRIIVIK